MCLNEIFLDVDEPLLKHLFESEYTFGFPINILSTDALTTDWIHSNVLRASKQYEFKNFICFSWNLHFLLFVLQFDMFLDLVLLFSGVLIQISSGSRLFRENVKKNLQTYWKSDLTNMFKGTKRTLLVMLKLKYQGSQMQVKLYQVWWKLISFDTY